MIKMEKKWYFFLTLFIRRWYFLRLAAQLQNRNIINHSTSIVWLPKYTEHPHLSRSSFDTNNLFWFILHSCSGRCKRQHKTLKITQSFQYKLQVPRFLHFIRSVQRTLELSTTMNERMNPLTNNTLACSDPMDSQATRLSVIVAYCVIFVVSVVGNCSIALIVYKIKTMRKPINLFILNMAMSDLLFLITVGSQILLALKPNLWIFRGSSGNTVCKITDLLPSISAAVSIQSLVLITVDRYDAVVHPLSLPRIEQKRCPFFIFSTWILAVAVYLPKCLAVQLVEHPVLKCEMQWSKMFGQSSSFANFYLAAFVVFFYCPLTLITVLYSMIFRKLKTQKTPGDKSFQAEQKRIRRRQNVLKMSIAIVVGFALCWVPWSICALLVAFNVTLPCEFFVFWTIDNILMISNSAMNPCICFMFSRNYRMGLKRVVKCFRKVPVE